MHLFGISVFQQQDRPARSISGQAGKQLRAVAAVMLTLTAGVPSSLAQQTPQQTPGARQEKAASGLPSAPEPTPTQPLDLRSTQRNFSQPAGRFKGNPIKMYMPTSIAKASFVNSVRLGD